LSKFAGDLAPKGGVLVIHPGNLKVILANRPLTDAWGINIRMEARFNSLGIRNLLELKNYNKDKIRRTLGRYGYYLWANVNGEEVTNVNSGTPMPKSVGHSYCLPKKTTDKKYLSAVLFKLCEKTGRRLRALEMEAQNIGVYLAYTREGGLVPRSFSEGGIYKGYKTADKMFTTEEIAGEAVLFLENSKLLLPLRMMAVSVSRLTPVSSQMSLLEDNLGKKDLSRAVDKLNNKYGEYTVIRGQMFGTNDLARDRVGYRKSVEIN
jgi:DNA polymerase-4